MKKVSRTTKHHSSLLKSWYRDDYQAVKSKDYSKTNPQKNGKKIKRLIRDSLFQMQKGLCAYSERALIKGAIDHYDPRLKRKDGFRFDNMFLTDPEVNNKKGIKTAKLLKPDNKDYAPEKYLEYDLRDHFYSAASSFDNSIRRIVEKDIDTLNINLVWRDRKKKLMRFYRRLVLLGEIEKDIKPDFQDYPTAVLFMRESILNS